jgi:cytochrome c oxidase cbb3-type subunit 3
MKRDRDELLDHDADGIREFDNDLPRWWLYGFYLTIVFAIVYMCNYHVLATPLFGPPSIAAEYEAEMRSASAAAAAHRATLPAAAGLTPLVDQASLEKGRGIFESQTNLCFSCHRPDLGGLVGPNLTDDLWLHGCGIADVMHSITTGYPTRGMLPFGGGPTLADEQLRQLASYVLSKRGSLPKAPKPSDPARDKPCP